MFSEGPSFFVIFVCIEGKLKLSPKMEAPPKTVTVSWLVKPTYRLNMSGLDFLDLANDNRLTIVWTIYDFLADHGKIIYEILYD